MLFELDNEIVFGFVVFIACVLVVSFFWYLCLTHARVCVVCRSTKFSSNSLHRCVLSGLRGGGDKWCCRDCLNDWIWMQSTAHNAGTAMPQPDCFDGCGAKLTMHQLQTVLTREQLDRYCMGATTTFLRQTTNVCWCLCGAAYWMDRARHRQSCLFVCPDKSCNRLMCAGCGDVVVQLPQRRKSGTQHVRHACPKFKGAATQCPCCKTLVHKDQGCALVRCTSCNARFDYNTKERFGT